MDYYGFGRTDPFSDPVSYLPPRTYQTVPVNTPSQSVVPVISQSVVAPPPAAAAPLSQYSSFYQAPARPVLAPPRTEPQYFPVTAAAATTQPIRTVDELRPRTPIQGYNTFHGLSEEEQLAIAIAESERMAVEEERKRGMIPGFEDDYLFSDHEDEKSAEEDDDDEYSFYKDPQTRRSMAFSRSISSSSSSSSSNGLKQEMFDPDNEHLITLCPIEGEVYGDNFGLFIVFSNKLTRKQVFTALSAPKQVKNTKDDKYLLQIFVTEFAGRMVTGNYNARNQVIRKNIFVNDWGPFMENLDKFKRYDKHTIEIDNLIRSAAKVIDPNTENNFADFMDRLFYPEQRPKKPRKHKKKEDDTGLENLGNDVSFSDF